MVYNDRESIERPFFFRNRRGQRLFGILHVPRGRGRFPVVVMAHGFTDDKTGDNRLFVRFSRQAVDYGIAVFRFDFAGSGDSEGDFSRMTLETERDDLRSAIGFVSGLPEVDSARISLIGYSLGGAIAIWTAAHDRRVKGFVGWAPVAFPRTVFRRLLGAKAFIRAKRYGTVASRNGDKQFYLRKEFFDSVEKSDIVHYIGKTASRPVAIIQGAADRKVLPEETRVLARSAGKTAALHTIDGAGHSFARHEEELIVLTLRHLREWGQGYGFKKTRSRGGSQVG